MRMVKEAEGTPWLDIRITRYLQLCERQRSGLASFTKEVNWLQYRGVIDIDGNVNAWGLFWRLASGSVVFKVRSNYLNYYISRMIPWEHYIPLEDDLSDFKNVTSIVTRNGSALNMLESIASHALQLSKTISYSSEIARVRNELNRLFYFSDRYIIQIHPNKTSEEEIF